MDAKYELENVKCIKATEKAILVEADEIEDSPVWIPQSQVHADSEVFREGDEGKLVVTEWFAIEKGWLD